MPYHVPSCPNCGETTRYDDEGPIECDCADLVSNNEFFGELLMRVFDARVVEIIFYDVID